MIKSEIFQNTLLTSAGFYAILTVLRYLIQLIRVTQFGGVTHVGLWYLGLAGIAGGMLFARVAVAVHPIHRRIAFHGILFRYGELPEPEITGGAENVHVYRRLRGRGGGRYDCAGGAQSEITRGRVQWQRHSGLS